MIYFIESSCQIPTLPKIYFDTFGDKNDGVFVEVGAFDGRMYSNTWGLACLGWRGLYVEPDIELCEICRQNHFGHKVVVEQACVGNGSEVMLFDAIVPTIDPQHSIHTGSAMYLDKSSAKYPKRSYKTVLLDELLEKHKLPFIDVLVIDVEGMETQVLQGFTLDKHNPRMVIIEACENHPVWEFRQNTVYIENYFKSYKKVYSDTVNNIYVKQV